MTRCGVLRVAYARLQELVYWFNKVKDANKLKRSADANKIPFQSNSYPQSIRKLFSHLEMSFVEHRER